MRLVFKILLVLGMTLAILMPLMMIRGTISERQAYRDAGGRQHRAQLLPARRRFAGPVLVVPYVETVEVEEKDDKGEVVRKVKRDGERTLDVLPGALDVAGQAAAEHAPAAACTRCASTNCRRMAQARFDARDSRRRRSRSVPRTHRPARG